MANAGFQFTVRFDGTDVVQTPGVDFSGKVRLKFRAGAFAVLHAGGGTHWAGIGCRYPHPARWWLVRIDHQKVDRGLDGRPFERERATIIEETEPGLAWRRERERLIVKAKSLAMAVPA